MILAVLPPEEAIDDLHHLHLQRLLEHVAGDDSVVGKDEAESLQGLFLNLQRAGELIGSQHPALDQHGAETILQSVAERIRPHDLAVQERDGDRIVFAAQREHAGLPLQTDELKDIGQTEVAKGSFQCH